MPASKKLLWVGRLPGPLAWVVWAIMAILNIAGAAIGSIAMDLYHVALYRVQRLRKVSGSD